MRKLTTEEFIQRAREVHGDKYDYSLSVYTTKKNKVKIICPKHGVFEQSPDGHLRGQGCPKCKGEKLSREQMGTLEDFVERANKVHNNKYDYSKFVYNGMHSKSTIICPEHGEFIQEGANHLAGKGCPECAKRTIGEKCRLPQEQIIKLAKQIHPEYDYSKSVYKGIEEDFNFICPVHGEVKLKARSLVYNGCGCPRCHKSKGENLVENYLKHYNINYITQYKIKTPKEIRSSGYSYVDFYIPDYNLIIEFNGIQHYKPVERFGGQIVFESQQKRDQYIREYCNSNGIKLLEIPYNEINVLQLIDKALNKNLNKNIYKFVGTAPEEILEKVSDNPKSTVIIYKNQEFSPNECYIGVCKEVWYDMLKTFREAGKYTEFQLQFQQGKLQLPWNT